MQMKFMVGKPEGNRSYGRHLKGENVKMLTGLNWLRIGSSGGLLWTRYWSFEFNVRRGTSWAA